MRRIFLFFLVVFLLTACIFKEKEELKYICYDGRVVSSKADCPQFNNLKYVCPDGSIKNSKDECKKVKELKIVKYVCPDGKIVDNFSECALTLTTTTTTTTITTTITTTSNLKSKEVEDAYNWWVEIVAINLEEEWVEIKNKGPRDVDMSNWTLADSQHHVFRFPDGFFLPSHARVRVYTRSGINTKSKLYWNRSKGVWNDNGDIAILKDSKGRIIDRFKALPSTTTSTTTTTTTISTTSTTTTTSTTSTTTTSTTTLPIGAVIITEIMYNPGQCNDSYCEYIEIYNTLDFDINLSNFKLCGDELLPGYISHEDGKIHKAEGLLLKSKNYAIITDGGSGETSGTLVYSFFNVSQKALALHVDSASLCDRGLRNSGEMINLTYNGNLIDFIKYTTKDGGNGNNKSLHRVNESTLIEGTPTPGW